MTAAPYQTEPRRALVRPGGSVSLLGRAGVPLDFCHFYYPPSYGRIDLSQGPQSASSRDYEYYGAGLEVGECGITLRNIHDGMDGIVESKIKASDKSEWENAATTLRVTSEFSSILVTNFIIFQFKNLSVKEAIFDSACFSKGVVILRLYLYDITSVAMCKTLPLTLTLYLFALAI